MKWRQSVGSAAREIADHLQLIERVSDLQTGQKELGKALEIIGDRLRTLEADMAVLKAETKLDAIKEAQAVVYAVQNGLNQRIEDLAVRVALQDQAARRLPDRSDG